MPVNKHQKKILVYADWTGFDNPLLMGYLYATPSRNKEIFSFEYTDAWLRSGFSHIIDPDLQFYSGQQYINDEKINFGIFLDSCPDRWGRILMQRREAILARKEKRPVKTLLESDYLLGVYDHYRMGALRFKEDLNGPFVNNDKKLAVPPWTSLRELVYTSLKYEEEDFDNQAYLKWINLLIAPGSSLGGARPKASVVDPEGWLWIAKFPSAKDDIDAGAWEMVVNNLALKAGINVPKTTILKLNNNYHTFLTKRFDRADDNNRIHFASAMTLMGFTDGDGFNEGVSYLNLAEFIIRHGANTNHDLEELWRRIVFYICVKNTDDHLRNHGFLLTNKGWILSPAFDINPNRHGQGLSLNISENDNSLDTELALKAADFFRINYAKAKTIINEIIKSVSNWKVLAKKYEINKSEQELMSDVFIN